MNTSAALKLFRDYQKTNLKPNTGVSYRYLLDTFEELFGVKDLGSITRDGF